MIAAAGTPDLVQWRPCAVAHCSVSTRASLSLPGGPARPLCGPHFTQVARAWRAVSDRGRAENEAAIKAHVTGPYSIEALAVEAWLSVGIIDEGPAA